MRNRISFSRSFFLFVFSVLLLTPVFALASDVHPLFNVNSTTQSPFPSDRFTEIDAHQLTHLRVKLPFPNCTTHPSDCLDVALLNQLDGFNTQPRLYIPFDGAIDPNTVNSSTVFLVRLGSLFAANDSAPVIIGINQVVWDPASLTLFAESNDHLDQDTSYLLLVTNGIHDASGNPISASQDFANLVFAQGSASRNGELAAYAGLLKRVLSNLPNIGVELSPNQIAAASIFTTGSVTSTLEKIRDQIKAAPAPSVDFKLGTNGERTVFSVSSITGIIFNRDRPTPPTSPTAVVPTAAFLLSPGSVGTLAFGKFTAMNWETADAFIPVVATRTGNPAVQSTEDLFFNLFIPAGTRPTNGWPVAIFGHGFGDSKQGAPFAVAAILAQHGIAVIAINAVGHGFGPNGTLAVSQGTTTTILPAGGRGVDQNGSNTFDSTEGLFAAGAHTDIATRDGLQQTVADLMQLVRAIQGGIDADNDGRPDLNPNQIFYFGQSLGGIYGTDFLGVEPDVKIGVPNVPGGSLTNIAVLSPNFRPLLGAALAVRVPSLENLPGGFPFFPFADNTPLRDQPPLVNTVPGAIAIQNFIDVANWLQQAGDPVAWAPFVRKSPLPGDPTKSVIIQFARGDKTVPNPTATALIRSGDLKDRTSFFRNDLAFAFDPVFPKNPHTFLTNISIQQFDLNVVRVAITAQTQIAEFFSSNGTLTDPLSPLAPLFFEVPIAGPLPEDLGFI